MSAGLVVILLEVISVISIRIVLTYAILNDLDVYADDINNIYVQTLI